MTKYREIISSGFVEEISPFANIEIYDSNVELQKSLGCSYFSIDGAMMLATPSERNYAPNVMEYMKKHGKEKNRFEEKNVKYFECSRLPTRLIQGMQYVEPISEINEGLETLVFNNEEKHTIVNKKGESAEIAIQKDLAKRPSATNPNQMRTLNLRAERKMRQYQKNVADFINDQDILSSKFTDQVNQCKIKGLVQFCQEQMVT